jgi:hypothetical protein
MTLNSEILGLPIPDAGPVFATALVIHILSGLTAVIAGALAATARKRPGRHPRAGRVYLWALGGIFTTATIMAIIRWHEDAHLFAIAVIAFSLGLYGYRARRRHRPGWPPHHAIGMGGSYIALLTGFYVDNGPFLPLWDRLPPGSCPASSASHSSGMRYDASRRPRRPDGPADVHSNDPSPTMLVPETPTVISWQRVRRRPSEVTSKISSASRL